jgi:ubiquinone/menaquinone biosynthesis C-methylase UbiE
MQADIYTLGYGSAILSFMGQRTADIHAAFALPHLRPGWRVLDAGAGPGTITLGLARRVAPGQVIGIDVEDCQFAGAREEADRGGLQVDFRKGSVYELPFPDHYFDAVFSHALLEHLSDPGAALRELRRTLKPGGLIAVRAGDLGGLLIDAASEAPAQAFATYIAQRKENSGDPNTGRKLGRLLRKGGFTVQQMTASYEVISEALRQIGPSLAEQFVNRASCSLEDKPGDDSLFVALAWCEAIGRAT